MADCVIVGYNETSLADNMARAEKAKNYSGSYRHLKANTLQYSGGRIRFTELINRCVQNTTGSKTKLHVANMPNLGVYMLASYLEKRNLKTSIVNYFNDDKDEFKRMLAEKPLLVAITTTYYTEHEPITEVAEFIKKHSPESKIVVGGPHIFNVCTDYPESMQNQLFDRMLADFYINDSQGEQTLARLCSALKHKDTELNAVPNLIIKKDKLNGSNQIASSSGYIRTEREVEDNPIDDTAVDWNLFDKSGLSNTIQTRTARSCAFKCAFCRYPIIAGDLHLTSMAKVEEEFDYLHSIGVTHLLFIDDTFNIPKQRFKDLCRLLASKNYQFKWFSYFRCANADDECFDLMEASGCTGVFLGIESGNSTVLKVMNKGANPKRYAYGINKLHEKNIMSYASFIIGHPGETRETALETIDFIQETAPTFYCLETFFYDHKVPIAKKAKEYQMTGNQYTWKHEGMDWKEASDLVEYGYKNISSSTIVPLYSFDLWTMAYLMGKGFSRETLQSFLKSAAKAFIEGIDADYDVKILEPQLTKILYKDAVYM